MRPTWPLALSILLASAAPAFAQAAGPAAGPTVSAVEFSGAVSDVDRLRELSSIQVGKPFTPQDVRDSLQAFYQKGLWSAITASEQTRPDGTMAVTFRFIPQLLLADWTFKGNKAVGANVLARALDLNFGDPINPNAFAGYVSTIRDRYVREGYFDVKVRIEQQREKGQMGRLVFHLDEGTPLTVSALQIIDPGPLSVHEIESGLGVRPGDRLPRDTAFSGLERIESTLSNKGYLNSHLGYYFVLPDGSRQTSYSALADAKVTQVALAVAVEAGQKALVTVDADTMLPTSELAQALTVYKNRSYSPAELDFSADNLRKLYVANGYPDAEVSHAIAKQPDGSYMITFTVNAGKKVAIQAIEFQGNKAFTDDQLRRVLVTQPARRFLDGGAFVPETWETDMANLVSFYETQGFLSAKVTAVDRLMDEAKGRLTLVVHVDEGPRTVIARLLFKGATGAQEAGILQALPINPGDPYNPRRMGDYVASVEAYYARTGYPVAKVDGRFEPGPTPAQSALVFTVQPGPRKRIGHVIFRGNLKTQDWVVRRQLTTAPGEIYNSEEILRTQQQIYQLGFFDRVNIGPLRPISADPKEPVDLVVDMHERETGSVAVGGGYGDLQGPQASAEYLQTNLFGTGRPLRLEGLFSQRRSSATFTLRDPYIFGAGNIAEVGMSYLRDRPTTTLDVETYGPTVSLSRQIKEHLLGNVRYSLGRTHYYEPERMTPTELAQTGGLFDYTNSIISPGVTYDDRSDILNPRWGTRTDLSIDVATHLFGGTLFYTRPRLSWSHFIPFAHQVTLALGADLGYIRRIEQGLLPPDVLFRTGGGNTLRGYAYNEVGVNGTSQGGAAMLVGHGEVRFPIHGDIGGVVFSDVGNVWESASDLGFTNLRVSTGLGLRYYTPIGPIRVDYAVRVFPQVDFGFDQGWAILGRNLYFGIGHAF